MSEYRELEWPDSALPMLRACDEIDEETLQWFGVSFSSGRSLLVCQELKKGCTAHRHTAVHPFLSEHLH
jgi:hypothetical protein